MRWLVVLLLVLATPAAAGDRRSGRLDMSPSLRAMQDDDAANPGMLWVLEGAQLWSKPAGPEGRSCAGCHGEASAAMKGVATRYPAFAPERGRPVTLEQRINLCRERNQGATRFPPEHRDLLALSTFVGHQSRGLAVVPADDPRLEPAYRDGETLFHRRMGQLNLACSQCHDDNAGKRLGGAVIPQAHPTGYPIYRLEWQGQGSLRRRLRACLTGVRAEPFADDGPEYVALELYLMRRAAGMPLETPAVRP